MLNRRNRRLPFLSSDARLDDVETPDQTPSGVVRSQSHDAQRGVDRRPAPAPYPAAGGDNATATEFNNEDEASGGAPTETVRRRYGRNDPYVPQQDPSRVPGDYRRTGPAGAAYPRREPGTRDDSERYPAGQVRRSQSPPRRQQSDVANESHTSSRRRSPPASTFARQAVVRSAGHPPPTPQASIQAPPRRLSPAIAANILTLMQRAHPAPPASAHAQVNNTASSDGSTADSSSRSSSPGSPPPVPGGSTSHGARSRPANAPAAAPSTLRRPARDAPRAPPAHAAYTAPAPPPMHYSGLPPMAHGNPPHMSYGQPPPAPHGHLPPMIPAYPQYLDYGYAPPPPPMGNTYPAYMYAPGPYPGAPAAVQAGPSAPAAAAINQVFAYPALTDSLTYPRYTEGLPPPPGPPPGCTRRYRCLNCHQVLDTLKEYENHMKLHEKKPFKCEVCGNGFVRTGERRKHVRKFHAASGYEPYVESWK